jgi:hypothetical protein
MRWPIGIAVLFVVTAASAQADLIGRASIIDGDTLESAFVCTSSIPAEPTNRKSRTEVKTMKRVLLAIAIALLMLGRAEVKINMTTEPKVNAATETQTKSSGFGYLVSMSPV